MTTTQQKTQEARPERMPAHHVVAPLTDVYEQEDALVIVADVPGVDPSRVDVSLEHDTLTLRAATMDREPKNHGALYREFSPVDYERSFTIAADIDAERVKATVRHGVLTVVLPKSPKAKPRKIAVNAE
jgi:HSP20 family molecular chaperone IbpA